MTNQQHITDTQRLALAKRVATLSADKKALFRETLEKEGIDPWQLPIVPQPSVASESPSSDPGAPLSFAQQRLWLIEQMEQGNSLYNLFFALRFDATLEPNALSQALHAVVQKHPILRTNYRDQQGGPRQIPQSFSPFEVPLTLLPQAEEQQEAIADAMARVANTPFDLASDARLLRVELLQIPANTACEDHSQAENKTATAACYIALFCIHHIAFDAISMHIFMQELSHFYSLALAGDLSEADVQLPADEVQYSDFATWQRDWSQSDACAAQADYWQQQLQDAPAHLPIATRYRRPLNRQQLGAEASLSFSPELSHQIRQFAAQSGATLYAVMLAGFHILLGRYSGQEDICIGTSVANRLRPELAKTMGFLVNTLVMRNQSKGGMTFQDFVSEVQTVAAEAIDHQDYPFDQLLEQLALPRQENSSPLFQVMFVLNNALDNLNLQLADVDVALHSTPIYKARFDLTLRVTDGEIAGSDNCIRCDFEYDTALYSAAYVETMLLCYEYLFKQVVVAPECPLRTITTVPDLQQTSLLQKAPEAFGENVASKGFRFLPVPDADLAAQIEHWGIATPDTIALVCAGEELSYRALNRQANQLAQYLLDRCDDKPVGLALARSNDFIIGLLAALKAGVAYVPLDVDWPIKRIQTIANDAQLHLILSDQAADWGASLSCDTVSPKHIDLSHYDPDNLAPRRVQQQDCVYIIYTSGSSGTPKGVVLSQGNVLNYLNGMQARLQLGGANYGLISTVAADLGNTAIFGALCFGGTLQVISTEMAQDAQGLSDYLAQQSAEQQIQVLKIVPSHLQGLLAAVESAQANPSASQKSLLPSQCLIVGGEACSLLLVRQVQTLNPDCRIVNHYGPTETTVGALTFEYQQTLPKGDCYLDNLPIGKPLLGNQAYVVDAYGQLCPQGVPGELMIVGKGVAQGYLNQPQQNASAFFDHALAPFSQLTAQPDLRGYRTGDRVRLLPSGDMEFLGRIDNQVKVRGYRVELGEITASLLQCQGVQQASVILADNHLGQAQLLAYVVLRDPGETALDTVKLALSEALPDYMQPQWWSVLEQMPLTANGKVDHKQLPAPDEVMTASDSAEAPVQKRQPRDDKERTLLAIWQEVLRCDDIGIDDSFFALGGDSILSLQIIAKAKKAGLKLSPKQLFEHKTIAQTAAVCRTVTQGNSTGANKAGSKGLTGINTQGLSHSGNATTSKDFALTPIQHWFFELEHGNPSHWNQSALFKLQQPLNLPALQQALRHLVQHHSALRLQFQQKNGTWVQRVKAYTPALNVCQRIPLPTDRNSDWQSALQSHATEVQQSLDITQGKLMAAAYFDADDDTDSRRHLLIAVHHLAIDGVSWRVLLNDLQLAYEQALTSGASDAVLDEAYDSTLLSSGSDYCTWSQSLQQVADSDLLHQELAYWQQHQTVAGLPTQGSATHNTLAQVVKIQRQLSKADTQGLLQTLASGYQGQINDLLISVLARQMAQLTESDWVLIELEGHGRDALQSLLDESQLSSANSDSSLDIGQTLGWFTSRYPLYLNACADDSDALLKSIKQQLREVPNKGAGFGLLRYLSNRLSEEQRQGLIQRQQAQLCFNYLGQFDFAAEEQSLLQPSELSPGIERDPRCERRFLIDINAAVKDGQLQIEWHYNSDFHDGLWMATFADDYCQCLQQLLPELQPRIQAPQFCGFTPADFPLLQLDQPQLEQLPLPLPWRQVEAIYPLTPMQEGLLFHTLMNPGTGIYFMQYRYEFNGHFDHEAFVEAWNRVVERHEVLRTAFLRQEEQALQVVFKQVPTPVAVLDWREVPKDQLDSKLQHWMQQQLQQGFDLSQPCQLAITLIQVADDKYQMIRSFHHILTDAWCFSLLMMDFLTYYHGIVDGDVPVLSKPRPFQDYVAWLQQQDRQQAQQYWQDSLAGFYAPTPIVVDEPVQQKGVEDVVVRLTQAQTQQLQQVSQQAQVTLNTLVQGAWGLLLSRYSGETDIVFGVTVAGRPTDLEGAQTTVGLFINTLPLRLNADPEMAVEAYVQGIFASNLSMREFEFAPLVDIQAWSDVPAGEPLFDTLFVYENAPIDPEMYQKLGIVEVGEMTNRTHTNYAITLVILPGDELQLQITYDRSRFTSSTIQRMLQHFQQLLLNIGEGIAANATVAEIELLSLEEQRQLLLDWNQSDTDYPAQACWPELFAQQVQMTPEAIAVSCGDASLSYLDLYLRAAQVAQALNSRGVGADDIVAVLDHRGLDLLCMITGVLLAGAAYLPLDPKHPKARLEDILALAQAKLVLTSEAKLQHLQGALTSFAEEARPPFIVASQLWQADTQCCSNNFTLDNDYSPQHLAYVIYTSGSTGVPKGAMIEHLGMLNNLYAKIPALDLQSGDKVAQTASQCFDISVWQLLTPLLCGAQVCIYPDEIAGNPPLLLQSIAKDNINVVESVPSVISGFLSCLDTTATPPLSSLRWLLPTGEALSASLAKRWLSQFPHVPLMNAYGPAECSDDVAIWRLTVDNIDQIQDPVPIGQPTDNNRLYVLDSQKRLQPIGVPGELYIAGTGVGRGYLNDPERSASAFLDNHLLAHPLYRDVELPANHAPRLYRSGDVARWREDGVLEYLGRSDHQVKIRGYRIELGEIEACLQSHPQVRHAAVVVKPDPRDEDCLVAYYQGDQSLSEVDSQAQAEVEQALEQDLQRRIKEALPEYMLPQCFMALDTMPLNNNGKIDRRHLPQPVFHIQDTPVNEPRTATEAQLVALWRDVLKREQIDIHASFFALGGHSLLAAQLHAKVCQQFAVDLPLRTLFEQNTVAQVATQIDMTLAAQTLMTTEVDPLEKPTSEDTDMEEFEL